MSVCGTETFEHLSVALHSGLADLDYLSVFLVFLGDGPCEKTFSLDFLFPPQRVTLSIALVFIPELHDTVCFSRIYCGKHPTPLVCLLC